MASHVREKQWNENIFEHGKQTLAWKSCRLGVHTSNGSVLKTYLINNVSLSRTQRRDSYPIRKSCQTYHVLMWRWPKSCFRACIESSINKNPILFLIFRGLLFQCLSESNNYWEKSSTAVELPVAILLIVLYELPLASLHKATATFFWMGIALWIWVFLFSSLLLTNFTMDSNIVPDIWNSNRQKSSYGGLWLFFHSFSNHYSSLGCVDRDLPPFAESSMVVVNINFSISLENFPKWNCNKKRRMCYHFNF